MLVRLTGEIHLATDILATDVFAIDFLATYVFAIDTDVFVTDADDIVVADIWITDILAPDSDILRQS